MRNSIQIESLDSSLQNICSCVEKEIKSLTTTVIDNPTFLRDFTTDLIFSKRLNDLVRLGIFVHYTNDEFLKYYSLDLLMKEMKKPQNFVLRFFVKTKAEMLLFLCQTNLWSTWEFFGLVSVTKLQRSLELLSFKRKSKFVAKTQRKRGYDDKGNLRHDHQKLPTYDVSLDKLMRDIQKKRKSIEDTYSALFGFIT